MVGCEEDGPSTPFSLPQELSSTDAGQVTFRRFVSQNRFVADHAVYAVQRIIEDACCTAFHEEKEPLIGWQSLDKLFEVLWRVFKKTGDESVVVGPSMSVAQNTEGVESSSVTAVATVDGSVAVADSGAHVAGETTSRCGMVHGNSVGGPGSTSATGGIGEWQAEGKWLLALQEASRHLCHNAILLLLQYVHHVSRNHLKGLNVGGKSIAGTFLVVASNASIDTATRIALLRCLPVLQCSSQKAAAFIRDTRCSVPLLAHTAKSIPVSEESRDDEVMKVLFNLCEDERMAAALAASSAFVSIAVDRANRAMERHRWTEVVHAIRFIEILLAYSADSSRIVESRGLLHLLLQLSDSGRFPTSVSSAAQRLLNSVQVQTNVL
ncbi:hypothetical protein TRSC58_04719 [Trypanosoma rangeli SC58]|uniref:Uncharacterized protein n=1 Tax=Trypanosoma rangeli SC58 TaxID=429131 RepID=A0A061IY64_TRYRA|nr:hypothetical protein TRSC58_04719 [Trypanosoma rangeli SC58]